MFLDPADSEVELMATWRFISSNSDPHYICSICHHGSNSGLEKVCQNCGASMDSDWLDKVEMAEPKKEEE